MSFIGNLLWFVFGGGFVLGLSWLLVGCVWCLTIVGIPIGIACFRIAGFAFLPFGKELVPAELLGEKRKYASGEEAVLSEQWCLLDNSGNAEPSNMMDDIRTRIKELIN